MELITDSFFSVIGCYLLLHLLFCTIEWFKVRPRNRKEYVYPYTYTNNQEDKELPREQTETFWSTFLSIEREQQNLPSEIDRDTVSDEVLRQRLVETGKFQYNDAALLVERMYKLGAIDRVSYDTYRRKK